MSGRGGETDQIDPFATKTVISCWHRRDGLSQETAELSWKTSPKQRHGPRLRSAFLCGSRLFVGGEVSKRFSLGIV